MDFQITIRGTTSNTSLKEVEREIRRFVAEFGALALLHNFNLEIPVVDLPEKPEPVTDGLNCVIRGGGRRGGHLDSLMRQAEIRMRHAERRGDLDAWARDYDYWLDLYGQKNGPFWRRE